ncbi:uncharacterized protein LOC110441266 [Mizuhopecten yessoensis]|uniref:uncharacterized protein LOC110441266 n=1 Tax=Mizuhopecten yessoensis TaxID=6573 RepID=UPI000B459BFB|nr:uncharacterized protein LOC110441266 [Mizuhopecten yessoensis]
MENNNSDVGNMIMRMFFVVEWILENQFSVIPFRNIVSPMKNRYEENNEVQARWGRGKSVYPARIVKTSDNNSMYETLKEVTVPVKIITKPKGKTGVKEKSSKKQKEDLEKAASNLELLEFALEKSSFGLKTPQKSVEVTPTSPSVLCTPAPTTPRCQQETPTSLRRSPKIARGTLHRLSLPYDRPSTSWDTNTSSVLKSAFRTLNQRDFEMEDTPNRHMHSDHHMNVQQRVAALESWLFTLQQEVNQQRFYINWLYNEQQNQNFTQNSAKEPMGTPGNHQDQSFSHNTCSTNEPIRAPDDHQHGESLETAEHSFTKDQLRNLISQETNISKGAKLLFKKLYSREEIAGRSLTGQKANQLKAPKPAIENQAKLALLYEIVMEKWPFTTKPMINEKLRLTCSNSVQPGIDLLDLPESLNYNIDRD